MSDSHNQTLLILDIDETLIYAVDAALDHKHSFKAGPYFVYERPHLDQFIDTVASAFRLAVWSSSTSDYVATVVDHIFPRHVDLQFQWGRDRCVQRYHPEWQTSYWVKDLKKVKRRGFSLDRVLMVDDTPQKLERNYGNAIYIRSFEGDRTDNELQRLAPYLLSLADCPDVRAVEKRGWRSHSHLS